MNGLLSPRANPWWVNTFLAWAGLMILWALGRSFIQVRHYGVRAYLRSFIRIEPETWLVIAVLLFCGIAVALAFGWPYGLEHLLPWP